MKKIAASMLFIALLLSCADDFYQFAKWGPKPDALYLVYAGNFTGNLGGTDTMDALCRSIIETPGFYMGDQLRYAVAFLADSSRSLRDLIPETWGDLPVRGLPNYPAIPYLSTSWDELWNGNIDNTLVLMGAAGLLSQWWTGVNDQYGSHGSDNCSDWTDDTLSFQGSYGNTGISADDTWVNAGTAMCTSTYSVLCLAF